MTDHTTQAAGIIADMTGLPADDAAIQREAARIAPRLTTTDPDILRTELIAELGELAVIFARHLATLQAVDGRAA
jgi:hypothetical protein